MRSFLLLALLLAPLAADAQMLQLIVNAQTAAAPAGGVVCSVGGVDLNAIAVNIDSIGVTLC